MYNLIKERTLIITLINAYGSPLNILFPQNIDQNVKKFGYVFKTHKLNGNIYYAHKSNKSLALVSQIRYNNLNIDVASEQEFKNALTSGFNGSMIEATGPKNLRFLTLALLHNSLVQVDDISEIKRIISLHQKLGIKERIRIIVRFSGFTSKESRFGIHHKKYMEVVEILDKSKSVTDLKGFSFHLDVNTSEEKIGALEKIFQLYEKFQSRGFEIEYINIGGGFKVNYLQNENEWNNYISNLNNKHNKELLTWRNTPINHYEYFNKSAGSKYLDEILSTNLRSTNTKAGNLIGELMLKLMIEPGRSLLDQTGITCAKVNFVKKTEKDEILIGLDMNRSNLASTDQEMMLDPIILYNNKSGEKKKVGVYFVGNLCLESDFVYKHKTFLSQIPEEGDIVIFVNTAAYNMDFTESTTAQQKIARKVAVIYKENKFHFFEDSEYNPYLHL
ncbi:MAG TPA: hypothetical protein VG917_03235 [Patescibacteria group bacterium]|nr:hypothetical protein [Patescibacteria group bacterium]